MIEVQELTIHARLIAQTVESLGYICYVFEDLEYKDPDFHYITCIQFPNWNGYIPNIGEIGFVSLRYIQAGIDKWFDGKDFIPYNYSNIQFLKFIPETAQDSDKLIID